MARILHIAERERWAAACARGVDYTPAAYETEGFIHCCTDEQLGGVAQRYFVGRDDLVLLTVETGRLGSELRYEGVTERFPHLYGPLSLVAVVAQRDIEVDASGIIQDADACPTA